VACTSPYYVKTGGGEIPVPCNRCVDCKRRRVNDWVFRLSWEELHNSISAHFVTFTYNSKNVPLTPNGFMTLSKRHVQLFFKRLRKYPQDPDYPIRYYIVGEYGTHTRRPHYHAIIFNVLNTDYYEAAWGLGSIYIGSATGGSTAYVMKYIDKDNVFRKSYRHVRDDRQPEFQLLSKGLGAGYLTPEAKAWHLADLTRNYVVRPGGSRYALPTYYRKQIYGQLELEAQRAVIETSVAEQEQRAAARFAQRRVAWSWERQKRILQEHKEKKFRDRLRKRNKV